MFSPSELEKMPIELEKRMADLENRIMEDIVRRIRINDEITRSADWQIYRLKMLGESSEYIKQKIQASLKLSDSEINKLYDDVIPTGYARDKSIYEAVGKDFIPFEKNAALQQLIKSTITQTKNEMINITQSLGFSVDMGNKTVFTPLATYYQQILDNAVLEVTSGAFDYNSTLKRVVKEMTKSGLRTVDFASGWTNRIEVASRRALMTGITQVTSHINDMNAKELGTDYFEVSWHASARPSHQIWQGRVYSKKELESICGLGTGPGLMGWNCYHTYYPFIPGVSERTYTDDQLDEMNAKENKAVEYNGKSYTTYEATQRQRQLETLMRKQRHDVKLLEQGGASEYDLINAKSKYRSTMKQYTDFSKKMELPHQMQRVYTDNLGKVSNGKVVAKSPKSDIIKEDSQFGKKIGKHTKEYGLDPKKLSDRNKMSMIIDDIIINHDEIIVDGKWRGQGPVVNGRRIDGSVDFYIKGEDVVVVNKENKFVTILKEGVQNARVREARERNKV